MKYKSIKVFNGYQIPDSDKWLSDSDEKYVDGLLKEAMVLKHKSFNFKVIEGIIQDTGIIDEEEVQSL